MLREGYYLRDGVTQILAEMAAISYTPAPADFPAFLDQTSRNCLLQEHARTAALSPQLPRSRVSSEASHFSGLAKKSQLREVYSDTK